MSRPPYLRRSRAFLANAQLAPVRIRRQENSMDLKPTPHRMYVLAEAAAGRVRWYPQNRIGWRVDGALCNAAIREMANPAVGWLTEAGNAVHRTLTITETGQAVLDTHRGQQT